MHFRGHVGVALLCYSPVAAYFSWLGEPAPALFGVTIAAVVSTLPDIDQLLPIAHRGPTHTVWFAGASTLIFAGIGWIIGLLAPLVSNPTLVMGTATAMSVSSHILADSITPMGIRPFYPLSDFEYSFDIVYAADRRANLFLLTVGASTVILSQGVTLYWS